MRNTISKNLIWLKFSLMVVRTVIELQQWVGNEDSNSDDNIACSDDDKILMVKIVG